MKDWTLARRALPPLAAAFLVASGAAALPPGGGQVGPVVPPRVVLPSVVARAAPLELSGVALGSRLDALEARCKASGWRCTRSTRSAVGQTFVRLHVELPAGEHRRLIVVTKDGVVVSVKAYYRAVDEGRLAALTQAYGAPTSKSPSGEIFWQWGATTTAQLSLTGGWLLLTGVEQAKRVGVVLNVDALKSRVERAGVARLAARLADLRLVEVEPTVLPGEKLTVKITVDKLECYDEQDLTSVFHGDDPTVRIHAVHSDPKVQSGLPWELRKGFSDVESDKGSRFQTVSAVAFGSASDARSTVTVGESIGLHAAVKEGDTTSFDDEVGFDYHVLSYSFLRANAGRTLSRTLDMRGDGGYRLHYRVEIGQPVAAPRPAPAQGFVDVRAWAGTYAWNVDGGGETATLRFQPPSAAFPEGSLTGTWVESGRTLSVSTTRLWGSAVELRLEPGGRRLVGYLIGTPQAPMISGIAYEGATTRGFFMTRK